MRSPSCVSNHPLKSAHHTRLGASAAANGSVYGVRVAASCALPPDLLAPAVPLSCLPPAILSGELSAPTPASISADPNSCAPAATPTRLARSPPASDSDDAPVPALGLLAPSALLAGTA